MLTKRTRKKTTVPPIPGEHGSPFVGHTINLFGCEWLAFTYTLAIFVPYKYARRAHHNNKS